MEVSAPKDTANTNPLANQVNFKAGSTANCLHAWRKITRDPFVLQGVAGTRLDFVEIPAQYRVPASLRLKEGELDCLDGELARLWQKGVIEPGLPSDDQFISNVFLRPKRNGEYRVILDLSVLNKDIDYQHFKMDNLDAAVGLMKRGCFLASIDLKDAYYSIPITRRDRKYLRFWWGDRLFQYTCLPNGLAQAPRFFTKFLKPVFASLHTRQVTQAQ